MRFGPILLRWSFHVLGTVFFVALPSIVPACIAVQGKGKSSELKRWKEVRFVTRASKDWCKRDPFEAFRVIVSSKEDKQEPRLFIVTGISLNLVAL